MVLLTSVLLTSVLLTSRYRRLARRCGPSTPALVADPPTICATDPPRRPCRLHSAAGSPVAFLLREALRLPEPALQRRPVRNPPFCRSGARRPFSPRNPR